MKNPNSTQIQAIAHVMQHNPRFVEWVREWQQMELERLPSVANNVAVAQGRCQVLAEICKVMEKSLDLAAQSR